MTMEVWQIIATIIICLIVGGVAGAYIMFTRTKKQLNENPPINEKMIRAMFLQTGRTPSEAQVRKAMNEINKQK